MPTAPFSVKSWNFHSQLPVKVGVPLIVMSACFFRHHLILSDSHRFKNKGKYSELSGGSEPGKGCANCQMLFIWLWSITKIKEERNGSRKRKKPAPPPLHWAVCRFDSVLLVNFTERSTLGCFCINSITGQVTLCSGLWSISPGVRCTAAPRASREIFPHCAASCSLSLTFPAANLLYQRWKTSIAGGSGEQEEKSKTQPGFKVTLHLDGC